MCGQAGETARWEEAGGCGNQPARLVGPEAERQSLPLLPAHTHAHKNAHVALRKSAAPRPRHAAAGRRSEHPAASGRTRLKPSRTDVIMRVSWSAWSSGTRSPVIISIDSTSCGSERGEEVGLCTRRGVPHGRMDVGQDCAEGRASGPGRESQ